MIAPGSPEEPIPELLRSEQALAANPFHVTLDVVRGADGLERERWVVQHPGAVALIPMDDEGRVLLVRQYRHPARRWMLEIPAGTREAGEVPEQTAARELREETGFAAARLEHLGGTWMAPGFCTEFIDYYLATGLRHDPLPQDDDEGLSAPVPFTAGEIDEAVARGEIEDAKTLVALTLWRVRGRLEAS